MKRLLKEIFLFVLGLLLGFGRIYLFYLRDNKSIESDLTEYINRKIQRTGIGFLALVPMWAYILFGLIILMIVGIIFTNIVHIFTNSKNIESLSTFVSIVVSVLVALPLAMIFARLAQNLVPFSEKAVFIAGHCILFAVVFRVFIYLISASYCGMLKRPNKNFRVILCEAVSETDYEIREVLVKSIPYKQCFSYIRNYTGTIREKQFFQIEETVRFSRNVVDFWSYYRDGHPVDIPMEEFISRTYNADISKNLRMKKEEE